jgi:hypothetical protein
VVNAASDDQNGWDCIVEFPPPPSDQPADLAPPGPILFVQVKSSLKATKSCRLTLANALKMTRHPLASFVVLVTYERGVDDPSIYVRHLWSPLMETVLEEVRRADADKVALNKRLLRVDFTEADRKNGQALERMVELVDSFGHNYATQKQAVVDKAGREAGYPAGKLTFGAGVDVGALVDLSLGLIDAIEVDNVTVEDLRFGLKSAKAVEVVSGRITIKPTPVAVCTVTLLTPGADRSEINLRGQIFASGLPNLPRELRKFRVLTDLTDFVLTPDGPVSASVGLDTGERLPFETICAAAAIFAWAETRPLDYQVWVNGRVFLSGRWDLDPIETKYWPHLDAVLEPLAALAAPARRPPDLGFTVIELLKDSKRLSEFHGVLRDPTLTIRFELQDSSAALAAAESCRGVHQLEFGGYLFLALVQRPMNKVDLVGAKAKLSLGAPTLLFGAILTGSAEEHRGYVTSEMQRFPTNDGDRVVTIIPACL